MERRLVTLILINLASIMERADEALLPAVYDQVGKAFGVSPSALGTLTFIRALVQALASPLAAYLTLRHNRIMVIAGGAVAWAIATAAVGSCTAYWQAVIAKAFNGIGLAIVVPAIQSIVADYHKDSERGLGFGFLHGAGQFGTLIGGIFATLMAGQVLGNLAGWRFAFYFVAFVSLLLGGAIYMFAQDVQPPTLMVSVRSVKNLITIKLGWTFDVRTFQVIVAQGLAGQIPWQAISFATLWLELMGFKRIDAAISVGLLSVGNMLGSVFGGWVGDFSAQLSPNAGRILCAQFSALIGIPLSGILLLGLPQVSAPAWAYGFVLFLMGFLMSWNSPATNWPIFSEIVPTHLHTTVFAIDSMIEKSLAAAGAPLVGILAERLFGYASQKGTSGSDLDNANAIAKGLFSLMTIPFFLCFLIINLLYFTYPRDRDRVKKASPEVH
ncbi:unnamed protein product [Sphagnum jensenii]|uniref:Major facilitator superfamily (MFS) profile domain-containing protein n=1 Tax=Sphagnum jensenii TaxID=128206 RepID=A0ABP0WAC7_9BRYO